VVASHILFPSRYDNCEHVHHVLVHFENPKGAEGVHHSSSIPHRFVSCIIAKLEWKGKHQQTNFTPSSSNLLPKL
jgi:nitrate/TMAO reductase-like tetraheme cytochrome c subunit